MPGRIPEKFIDDLLARVDIVDVIAERLPLKKAKRFSRASARLLLLRMMRMT